MHMLADNLYVLRAGMVVTVQPPVFWGDQNLGARIIDNVLVTESGAELLARFNPKTIVVGQGPDKA